MNVVEAEPSKFRKTFHTPSHIFNSVDFAELNKEKAEILRYLIFEDTKIRAGIILGERNGIMASPFSAPFGGFLSNKPLMLEIWEEVVGKLTEYALNHGKDIMVTLPPLAYDMSELTKVANVMSRKAQLCYIDLNYSFDTSRFKHYESAIKVNARKNLHNALAHDMRFIKLDSKNRNDVERAYRIIKLNRQEHGYPLRMSLEDVLKTIKIIPADFFVLSYNDVDIAAAQVFHVAKGIAQVIYWGDLHDYYKLRTMNRLAYEMFKYYSQCGINILDIGPSSELGIPNYGLCEFKEGIGCNESPKFVFKIKADKPINKT